MLCAVLFLGSLAHLVHSNCFQYVCSTHVQTSWLTGCCGSMRPKLDSLYWCHGWAAMDVTWKAARHSRLSQFAPILLRKWWSTIGFWRCPNFLQPLFWLSNGVRPSSLGPVDPKVWHNQEVSRSSQRAKIDDRTFCWERMCLDLS